MAQPHKLLSYTDSCVTAHTHTHTQSCSHNNYQILRIHHCIPCIYALEQVICFQATKRFPPTFFFFFFCPSCWLRKNTALFGIAGESIARIQKLLQMDTESLTTSDHHHCHFKEDVPREFYCRKCSWVCRRLARTTCCRESFCFSCISPQRKDGHPCPSCGRRNYDISESEEHQERLKEFLVFCPFEREGCLWSGPFKELKGHLDPFKDGCQQVRMACPLGCQLQVPKRSMKQHVARDCMERELVCQNCQTKSSPPEQDIPSQSNPQCHKEAVDSKNSKNCTFCEDCEESELHRKLLDRLREQETKLQALSLELSTSKKHFQEQMKKNEAATKELRDMIIVKHDFEIGSITRKKLKTESSIWNSQTSYTFFSGYKYCICLASRGFSVIVQLKLLPGDFDHLLKWPLKASFTLELHNMSRGSGSLMGITGTRSWKRPPQASNSHVFYFRPNPAEIYQGFLEVSTLEGFLKCDKLCFSIKDVTIHSK